MLFQTRRAKLPYLIPALQELFSTQRAAETVPQDRGAHDQGRIPGNAPRLLC